MTKKKKYITQNFRLKRKEQGVTLITVMVFLVVMTIVSVSASKIAMLDVLIAGNDQRQMQLYQDTATDLKKLTTVSLLYIPLTGQSGAEFSKNTGEYTFPSLSDRPKYAEIITDKNKSYLCGGFAGKAISIGPNQPICDLYDFQINGANIGSAAKERHNRGAGKEKPNSSKNSYLNNNFL